MENIWMTNSLCYRHPCAVIEGCYVFIHLSGTQQTENILLWTFSTVAKWHIERNADDDKASLFSNPWIYWHIIKIMVKVTEV